MCIYKSTVALQNSSKAWGTGVAILPKRVFHPVFRSSYNQLACFNFWGNSNIIHCCMLLEMLVEKGMYGQFCALEHMSFHCANELFQNSDWHIVKGRLSTLSSAVFWVVCELLYMQADGAEIIRIVTFIAASCAEWEFLLLNTISQCKFSQPAGTYLSA